MRQCCETVGKNLGDGGGRVLEICRKPEAERAKNTSEKPEYCVPEMKIQRVKMRDFAMSLHFSGISAPFLTEKR